MITTKPFGKLLNVILERFASSDHDRKSHKKKKKKVLSLRSSAFIKTILG